MNAFFFFFSSLPRALAAASFDFVSAAFTFAALSCFALRSTATFARFSLNLALVAFSTCFLFRAISTFFTRSTPIFTRLSRFFAARSALFLARLAAFH